MCVLQVYFSLINSQKTFRVLVGLCLVRLSLLSLMPARIGTHRVLEVLIICPCNQCPQ